jgi:hypothetical protein
MNSRRGQLYATDDRSQEIDIPKIFIFLLFAAIVWITNFWHSASFGLYEDDWVRIPTIVELSWDRLFHKVIFDTGFQGRPFHDGLIFLFSFLGIKLGGLQYAYTIGSIIVTINAYLFYLLLERVYRHQVFALMGALTFCVFPADTTRDYLTHSLGIQPSLAFLLIAFHCYTLGYKKLSYLVVSLCLIAYEPLFTVFIAAPLFHQKWDSKLSRELFKHVTILIGLIIFAAIVRKLVGENQMSSFGVQSIALLVLNPIIGSVTSLAMLIYRPIETLLKLNGDLWWFGIPAAISFAWLISRLKFNPLDRGFGWQGSALAARFPKISAWLEPYTKPVIAGLVTLVLAYPLTMSTYGFAISGRTARVHVAAIIGVSILAACICTAILSIASKYGRRRLAIWGLAGFFALLMGFGLRVQQDYQLMWQHQRGFWTDVVRLCPDLRDGTVIFVEPTGLRDTRQPIPFQESRGISDPKQIKGLEWELPYVLQNIYRFPTSWKLPPKLYRLQSTWQDKLVSKQNLFHVSAAITWLNEDEIQREVESANVILLETKNGRLTRRIEPLVIGSRKFSLKEQNVSGLPPFERKYLYDRLIQAPTEKPVDYLIKQ